MDSKAVRLLIGLTFLSGMVFLFVPYSEGKHYWLPFSDRYVLAQNYVYHLFDKLAWVVVVVILAKSLPYRFLKIVVVFYVVDLIDYCLTYNEVWYRWGPMPVSWNTVGTFMVLAAIVFMEDKA